MKTNKLLILVIVVLAMFNVATLVVIWNGDKQVERSVRPRQKADKFLRKKLKLTDEQMRLFREAREEHEKATDDLIKSISKYRKKLSLVNEKEIDSIIWNIGELQKQIEYSNHTHLKRLKSYCTNEQLPLFDSVFQRILEHPRLKKKKRKSKLAPIP